MSSLIAEATDTDDQSPVKNITPLNSFTFSISLNAGFIFVFLTRNYFCPKTSFTFVFQVRPAGRISQLLLTKSHKDRTEAKPESLKKEEEVKRKDGKSEKDVRRKSGSLASTSGKSKEKKESTEIDNKRDQRSEIDDKRSAGDKTGAT